MLIRKVERLFEKNIIILEILLKDVRSFKFKFPNFNKVDKIVAKLIEYSSIISPSKTPGFILFDEFSKMEEKYQGWQIYDVRKEFLRQGVSVGEEIQIIDNTKGEVCKTYPPYLLIPKKVNAEVLDKCSKFRSKNRLPVLTYMYNCNRKNFYLWRSAQCVSGFTSRSSEDEMYFRILGDLSNTALEGGRIIII